MSLNFCTYFDSAYLTKALVCHQTLMKQSPVKLFVLCFDINAKNTFEKLENVVTICLNDIETYKPQLLSIKYGRQPKEYYATITPILPQFIFDHFGIDKLFYTDADMAFFSPVEEIEEIMNDYFLLVTPHENPIAFVAGRFNVGILGFKNNRNCREFLEWWEQRCIEWCEWRALSDGRCADQGYLNILCNQPDKFKDVLFCPQPGINLGAWNLAMHKVELINNKLTIDDKYSLVCYHFHGYKNINGQCINDTGWEVSPWNMKHIYYPYHDLILQT